MGRLSAGGRDAARLVASDMVGTGSMMEAEDNKGQSQNEKWYR